MSQGPVAFSLKLHIYQTNFYWSYWTTETLKKTPNKQKPKTLLTNATDSMCDFYKCIFEEFHISQKGKTLLDEFCQKKIIAKFHYQQIHKNKCEILTNECIILYFHLKTGIYLSNVPVSPDEPGKYKVHKVM